MTTPHSRWLLLAGLAACAPAQPDVAAPAPPEWIGPAGSGKPSLTRNGAGELLLSWFEPRGDNRYALLVSSTRNGQWTEAAVVTESDRFFVNWADFPSVVETAQGDWIVHWLEKSAAKSYAYHVRLARSADRGATWSQPVRAHTDSTPTEHGFVSMVPQVDGSVAIAWLDGRQMVDSGGPMGVRAGVFGTNGTMLGETLLDGRTCECCQVSMTRARSGLVAVYRDRSEEEVRDISVVRQIDGTWSEPVPVARDNWVWRACPVNGPSVAAVEDAVGVAWFTAANDRPVVKVAFSSDGAATFGPPVVADLGNPLGRVHFQMLSPTRGAVVWLEAEGDGARWQLRLVSADGSMDEPRVVGSTSRARDAGFPRTALVGDALYVSWTEAGATAAENRVRVSRIPLS